ncbi:hypothetical protein B0J14DRAFT_653641 [Halenospora varia]|nr:hypothetical protein B0J14DRAFT_653641 [Halenospora varia]
MAMTVESSRYFQLPSLRQENVPFTVMPQPGCVPMGQPFSFTGQQEFKPAPLPPAPPFGDQSPLVRYQQYQQYKSTTVQQHPPMANLGPRILPPRLILRSGTQQMTSRHQNQDHNFHKENIPLSDAQESESRLAKLTHFSVADVLERSRVEPKPPVANRSADAPSQPGNPTITTGEPAAAKQSGPLTAKQTLETPQLDELPPVKAQAAYIPSQSENRGITADLNSS